MVPLIAIAVGWSVSRGCNTAGPSATRDPAIAAERAERAERAASTGGLTRGAGAPSGPANRAPAAAGAAGSPATSSAGASKPSTASPDRPSNAATAGAPAGPGRAPSSPGRSGGAGSSGELHDKTGWGDPSVGKQLNREFMPLASECIEQAVARRPGLHGVLGVTLQLSPTENGKAIVTSIKPRPDNQVDDPELFECIRESSFSLDGLKAPHDFEITMPIEPEGAGSAAR